MVYIVVMPKCYECGKESDVMRLVSELDTVSEEHDFSHQEGVDEADMIPLEYEGEHLCEDCLEQYEGYV